MGRTGIAGTVGSWRVPRAARGSLGRSQCSVASGSAGINLGLVRTAQRVQVSVFRSVQPVCPHVCTCEHTGPGCASRGLPVQQGCTVPLFAVLCPRIAPVPHGPCPRAGVPMSPTLPAVLALAGARWHPQMVPPDGALVSELLPPKDAELLFIFLVKNSEGRGGRGKASQK